MADEAPITNSDELKQKLTEHIDKVRGKLETLKQDVQSLHEEDMEALRNKREEMRKRLDEQKERTHQLQSDISRWNQEKVPV